ARRRDVLPEVDPVGQAAPGELGDKRKQAKGESRKEALVPVHPGHTRMITPCRRKVFRKRRSGDEPLHPRSVRVYSARVSPSKQKSSTRCHWPRHSRPPSNGICSVRGPSRASSIRSRSGLALGTTRSSSVSISQKNPDSRSLTRTSELGTPAVTYAIPRWTDPEATSREISFVMSKTDRVGSAAATECGIPIAVI